MNEGGCREIKVWKRESSVLEAEGFNPPLPRPPLLPNKGSVDSLYNYI